MTNNDSVEQFHVDMDALKAKAIENRPHVVLFSILKNLRDNPELNQDYRDKLFEDAFKCLDILSKKFDEPKEEKSCGGDCSCSSKTRDPFKAKGCPSSCKHNKDHIEP